MKSTTNARTSEGNCALNAAYSVLRSWYSRGFIDYIPNGTQDLTASIVNDALYSKYGTGPNWFPNRNYLDKMPILYSELRDYAVQNCGYTPESGLSRQNARNAMSRICARHGQSIKLNYTSVISAVINYLEERKACYFSIHGSTTYNNHAVVLLGYRVYSYESGWWIFKKVHDAYFYKIADGWDTTPKYFDPNTGAKLDLEVTYLESY